MCDLWQMRQKTSRNSKQSRLAYLCFAHKRFAHEIGNSQKARKISHRLNRVGTRLVKRMQLQPDWLGFPAHVLGGNIIRERHCAAYLWGRVLHQGLILEDDWLRRTAARDILRLQSWV